MKSLNGAPLDQNGAIEPLQLNRTELWEIYDSALRILRSEDVPADAGTPWIQVGAVKNNSPSNQ